VWQRNILNAWVEKHRENPANFILPEARLSNGRDKIPRIFSVLLNVGDLEKS
jgi:hypothetical protein